MGPAAQTTCPFISLSLFSGLGLLEWKEWLDESREIRCGATDSWFGGPTVSVRAGEDPAACQSALAARRRSNRVEEGRSRSTAKCRTRNVVGFPASLTSRSMEPRRYRKSDKTTFAGSSGVSRGWEALL